MTKAAPRSLADGLRAFSDERLADLLRRRRDLLRPVPSDMTALAARATSGPSVSRCLDGLDALTLHVLGVVAAADEPLSERTVLQRATGPLAASARAACRAALADLVDLALVWGTPGPLRAVLPVRDLLGPARAPAWPRPAVPADGPGAAAADVDPLGAVHARESLALVRDLLDGWAAHPPPVLRSGALALRDFAAARAALHADWARAALTIELAHAALLVVDDGQEPAHWIPTDRYDTWLSNPTAEQWLDLVAAWWSLPRLPSLAGERTQVLSSHDDRWAVGVLRRDTIGVLASAPVGVRVPADLIEEILDDREPRRGGDLRRQTIVATLREAEDLGLAAGGVLTTAGRLIAADPSDPDARKAAARALEAALPADIDHVLIQADLTIVAPGPLDPNAARRLRIVADVESRGHATVYRVTEASVRRALDLGWDAATIHTLLRDLSRTPVPQPLSYLVDDVARRHGAVRVGAALSYVRCDDPDVLTRLLTSSRLRRLGLRRIAETVLVGQEPVTAVLTALRADGLAPSAEGPDGLVVIRRPDERRARTARPPVITTHRRDVADLARAAVRTLRAVDDAGGRSGPRVAGPAAGDVVTATGVKVGPQSASAVVAALRTALRDSRPVWLGYADVDGTVTTQAVDPIRLHGGVLTAFDHRTSAVRDFAVSRVTGIAQESES